MLGQAVPEAPEPFMQMHCLSAPHTASAVLEAGVAITLPCALQSTTCAEHEVPVRKNAPEHDTLFMAPSAGQAVPVAPVPCWLVHCLSAPHTASAVLEAGVATTLPCASQSTACAEHEAPARKKAPEHDAHLAAPLAGQLVLAEPVPLAHVHCLAAPHTASAVLEAGVAMTLPCASQSTTCGEHELPLRKEAPEHVGGAQ